MALIERVGSAFMSLLTDRKANEGSLAAEASTSGRPNDVGILAMEVYFPRTKVDQSELEVHDGVAPGKYTIGLGQQAMAFTGDQEDVVSMSLTVVQSLLEKFSIEPCEIGRLEVGTESSIDRSKSVKSFLMALFHQSGNSDVQGVDCINACYGGTAALFNAVNWVESRSWDGRYAIVVAADVAVYASGPARASGGCGAVAMLIGPDAPLVLEPGCSAAYMDDVYDFYKPAGIYPQVEGKLSIACYLTALDRCYSRLCQKVERLRARQSTKSQLPETAEITGFSLADVDFCVMHAPFSKMVRKGFARLVLQDCLKERRASGCAASTPNGNLGFLSEQKGEQLPLAASLQRIAAAGQNKHHSLLTVQADTTARSMETAAAILASEEHCSGATMESSTENASATTGGSESRSVLHRFLDEIGDSAAADLEDKRLEKAASEASAADFERMVTPGLLLGLQCGNMYAASVHASLASLVFAEGAALEGKRILENSFGSGLAASLFIICARSVDDPRFSLANIAKQLDLNRRLSDRVTALPAEFTAALDLLEQLHGKAGHKPCGTAEELFPKTYYLQEVDTRFRRKYARKS